MMQGEMNFDDPIEEEAQDTDTPHCNKCGDELIVGINWVKSGPSKHYYQCRNCTSIAHAERRKRLEELQKNKEWDPNYKKTCYYCKKELIAEEHFYRTVNILDGYESRCKACTYSLSQQPRVKWVKMRKESKRRGYDFTITETDCSSLLLKNCYYCGKPSQQGIKLHGIDRVDNSKGYHLDNVVPCCEQCNIAKHTSSQEDFIDMCKRVAIKHTTHEKSNLECIKVYLLDSEVGK